MNKEIYDLLKDNKRLKEEKIFIVDTEKILEEVIKNNLEIKYFLYTGEEKEILNKLKESTEIIKVKKSYIDKFSIVDSHQGFLAMVKAPEKEIKDFKGIYQMVMLDTIQEPSNLGAIIRNGVAFGFENYLLLNCAYIYNEKTIRASAGAVFLCNYKNIKFDEIKKLKEKYQILTTSSENGISIKKFKPEIRQNYILILGNEGHGVNFEFIKLSDIHIKIEHNQKIQSLNVASASAIIFYELMNMKEV